MNTEMQWLYPGIPEADSNAIFNRKWTHAWSRFKIANEMFHSKPEPPTHRLKTQLQNSAANFTKYKN